MPGRIWSVDYQADGRRIAAASSLDGRGAVHIFNDDIDCDTRDILQLPDGTYPVFAKVDDYTIRITLSTVFRPLIASLGSDILPKHKLAQYVAKLNAYVAPGTFNETWTLDTPPEELVGIRSRKMITSGALYSAM